MSNDESSCLFLYNLTSSALDPGACHIPLPYPYIDGGNSLHSQQGLSWGSLRMPGPGGGPNLSFPQYPAQCVACNLRDQYMFIKYPSGRETPEG